jgi:hypothetical protein
MPFSVSYLKVAPAVKHPYYLLALIVAIPKNHSKNFSSGKGVTTESTDKVISI